MPIKGIFPAEAKMKDKRKKEIIIDKIDIGANTTDCQCL